jgi:hypothetical protein
VPKYPLLAAPPERKRLCAPKIAGLLPARTQSAPSEPQRGDILIDWPPTRKDLMRQLGRVRSQEELEEEIAEIAWESIYQIRARRAEKQAKAAGRADEMARERAGRAAAIAAEQAQRRALRAGG